MLVASDFRERARMALQNNWLWAVLTGLVASILGAATTMLDGGGSGSSSSNSLSEENLEVLSEAGFDYNMTEILTNPVTQVVLAVLAVIVIAVVIWSIVIFIIGGPVTLGYAKYNLNLVDGNGAQFSDLFSKFDQFGQGFCVQFLRRLFITLWTLLLVIPGIVKSYSYSMAAYIAAENPDMSASDAITASKELMEGNKWRLFCLDLSFIGWSILCVFTLGIGYLFLRPYREAAFAAFYREIVLEKMPVTSQPQIDNMVDNDNPYFKEF